MPDILVVDDSEANRLLLSLLLKKAAPHRVVEAANGEEGVELFAARSFGLVLMDLEMPGLDGIAAAGRMRAVEAEQNRPRTPLAAMTAHDVASLGPDCAAAGFDERLQKPLTRDVVQDLLRRHGLA
jgi:CheY-like chemotaxis protein